MSLDRFGFIVTGAGLDPERHRTTLDSEQFHGEFVGITRPEQALPIAQQMVADGIQLIELCGGFGPVWTAKVLEAIDHAVPVGSVGYGPESITGMYRLFPE